MLNPYIRTPYRLGSRGWREEQLFTLSNFAGGFNNVDHDLVLQDNELSDSKNMMFVGDGLMKKRPGINGFVDFGFPEVVTWVDKYYPIKSGKAANIKANLLTSTSSDFSSLGLDDDDLGIGDGEEISLADDDDDGFSPQSVDGEEATSDEALEPINVYATDSRIYFGTDSYPVEGRVRGVSYIGRYYFVDGKNIYVYNNKGCYKLTTEPFTYLAKAVEWKNFNSANYYLTIQVDSIPDNFKNATHKDSTTGNAVKNFDESAKDSSGNVPGTMPSEVWPTGASSFKIGGYIWIPAAAVNAAYQVKIIDAVTTFANNQGASITNYIDDDGFFKASTMYSSIGYPWAKVSAGLEFYGFVIPIRQYNESLLTLSTDFMTNSSSSTAKMRVADAATKIQEYAKNITFIDSGTAKVPITLYEPSFIDLYGEEVWEDAEEGKIGTVYYKPCYQQLKDSYSGNSYIPDKPTVITVHSNRIFVSGDTLSPHMVYMSTVDAASAQPLYFPAAAAIGVRPNGEKIVDLIPFDNALIVGRHNDLYALYGDTQYPANLAPSSTQFYLRKMDASTGFMCTQCGALLNNYYFFLGYDGRFYRLNTPTTYVEYLMTIPMANKIDIFAEPFKAKRNDEGEVQVYSVPYDNEVYWAIETTEHEKEQGHMIVYNYDHMAYTYYDSFRAHCLAVMDRLLFFGSSYYYDPVMKLVNDNADKDADSDVEQKYAVKMWDKNGYAYYDYYHVQYSSANSDNKFNSPEAIVAVLATKRFQLDSSMSYKYFKRYSLTLKTYGKEKSALGVSYELDYQSSSEESHIPANYAYFNNNHFDYAFFGDQIFLKSPWVNIDARSRTIKFTLTSNNMYPFMPIDLNILYSLRDIR